MVINKSLINRPFLLQLKPKDLVVVGSQQLQAQEFLASARPQVQSQELIISDSL
jgi:hypothetical protein